MPDITSEINAVLSDHSRFDAEQLDIISFVNELDKGTLISLRTLPDRTIMDTYERLLSASKEPARRQRDEEYELESDGASRTATMSNHAAFLNASEQRLRICMVTATSTGIRQKAITMWPVKYWQALAGSLLLAQVPPPSPPRRRVRRFRYSGALCVIFCRRDRPGWRDGVLRNNFSDVQVATNKDFLETIKSIAKLRNKLNDFFQASTTRSIRIRQKQKRRSTMK